MPWWSAVLPARPSLAVTRRASPPSVDTCNAVPATPSTSSSRHLPGADSGLFGCCVHRCAPHDISPVAAVIALGSYRHDATELDRPVSENRAQGRIPSETATSRMADMAGKPDIGSRRALSDLT